MDWNARLAALRAEHVPDPRLGVWEMEVVKPDSGPILLTGSTTALAALEALALESRMEGALLAALPLPDPALGEEIRAVAYRSIAHLRREPRHGAELVSQIVMGEEALVLRAAGGWLQVQVADGYVGWVHEGSLLSSAPDDSRAFRERLQARRPPADSWIVVGRGLAARTGPKAGAPRVADLVQGSVVAAEPVQGALRVTLPDGETGWIPVDAAVPAERLAERFPAQGRSIVEHAADFLGLPYLWGGTSEKGFDCSGLVQRVYGLHGVALPRDSDQQARAGSVVEGGPAAEDVRAGDLAFFAEPPARRATHVGILAPGGRLLHASTTRGGVAWDAIDPGAGGFSPFGERLAGWLVTIRRVLPE